MRRKLGKSSGRELHPAGRRVVQKVFMIPIRVEIMRCHTILIYANKPNQNSKFGGRFVGPDNGTNYLWSRNCFTANMAGWTATCERLVSTTPAADQLQPNSCHRKRAILQQCPMLFKESDSGIGYYFTNMWNTFRKGVAQTAEERSYGASSLISPDIAHVPDNHVASRTCSTGPSWSLNLVHFRVTPDVDLWLT